MNIDITTLRGLLNDPGRFTALACSLPWQETAVTYTQETTAHPRQWAFVTEVRFPAGYPAAHFAETYVQTRITHLGCTEEWGPDFFKDWSPEDRLRHLHSFQSEYTGFSQTLSPITAEAAAQEITDHCKNPAVAESLLPLLSAGESVYIGWYGSSLGWDYLAVSGDTVILITLSVAA